MVVSILRTGITFVIFPPLSDQLQVSVSAFRSASQQRQQPSSSSSLSQPSQCLTQTQSTQANPWMLYTQLQSTQVRVLCVCVSLYHVSRYSPSTATVCGQVFSCASIFSVDIPYDWVMIVCFFFYFVCCCHPDCAPSSGSSVRCDTERGPLYGDCDYPASDHLLSLLPVPTGQFAPRGSREPPESHNLLGRRFCGARSL